MRTRLDGLSRPGLAWRTSSLARPLARARNAPARMQFCTCAHALSATRRGRAIGACSRGSETLANVIKGDDEAGGERRSHWHYLLKRRKRRARERRRGPMRAGSVISISIGISLSIRDSRRQIDPTPLAAPARNACCDRFDSIRERRNVEGKQIFAMLCHSP